MQYQWVVRIGIYIYASSCICFSIEFELWGRERYVCKMEESHTFGPCKVSHIKQKLGYTYTTSDVFDLSRNLEWLNNHYSLYRTI
jgi:hypothetical protein